MFAAWSGICRHESKPLRLNIEVKTAIKNILFILLLYFVVTMFFN